MTQINRFAHWVFVHYRLFSGGCLLAFLLFLAAGGLYDAISLSHLHGLTPEGMFEAGERITHTAKAIAIGGGAACATVYVFVWMTVIAVKRKPQ
jgi:hypothetical protein